MTVWRKTSLAGVVYTLLLLSLVATNPSLAYSLSGRITLGSYVGSELLAVPSAGDNSNDVATASGRFYLRITDVTDNRFEFVSDVRDKNDFFGLVDKQRLQLTNANTLQIRQLSAKYPGPTFFTEVGRFPVPEAGAVFADGALQGIHLSKSLRWAAFAGLNPKRPEQTYVQFNPDSQVYGTYLTYVPVYNGEGATLFIDTAGVADIVAGETDRVYWYTNAVYQWNPESRISLFTYLDFVPNLYLQNGTLNYQQSLGSGWLFDLNVFQIDVIEYQRLQSVREQLPSSPYEEAGGSLRYHVTDAWDLEASYLTGHREADGLSRQQTMLTSYFQKLFNRHWELSLSLGYRDNFISYDTFSEARITYASRLWEVELDEQYEREQYKNNGPAYYPLISELSLSRIFENALYGTLSYQNVSDGRAQINSFFIKISYRFGSKEIPPVRDGSPARGQL